MANILKFKEKKGCSLDKLAKDDQKDFSENLKLVATTQLQDKSAFLKKGRKKYFSSQILQQLILKNPKSQILKSYKNSLECSNEISLNSDGKLRAKYCKNRFCMTCNGIRTAKEINTYHPIIKTWKNAHLLTLTVPNCSKKALKSTIKFMTSNFSKAMRKTRKEMGSAVGIRKFECTYNEKRGDYHPHFHILVKDKITAQLLLEHWLKSNIRANRKAQDIRPADLNTLKELFKYMTKIFTKTRDGNIIDAKALDVIFTAIRGYHTVRPFGIKIELELSDGDEQSENNTEITAIYSWVLEVTDWVDLKTGELLTGYVPSKKFKELLKFQEF